MAYGLSVAQTGDKEILFFAEIHQSASQVARDAYFNKYGIDYHEDPNWVIGGERHEFWLNAFDTRQKSLILNPQQD